MLGHCGVVMQVNLGQKKVKEIDGVRADLSDDEFDDVFDALEGEQIDLDKWEVVDEQDYVEDYCDWADSFIEPKDIKDKFADEIVSKEDSFSYLDKSYYRVRFKYIKKSRKPSKSTRTFCKNMMRLSKAGFVYRI